MGIRLKVFLFLAGSLLMSIHNVRFNQEKKTSKDTFGRKKALSRAICTLSFRPLILSAMYVELHAHILYKRKEAAYLQDADCVSFKRTDF